MQTGFNVVPMGPARQRRQARSADTSREEADLVRAIAATSDANEQRRLIARRDALRAEARQARAAERDFDFGQAIVAEKMAPRGATHELTTTASDWLDEVAPDADPHMRPKVSAQARMWYQGLPGFVKAARSEVLIQAQGQAMLISGGYGTQAPEARSVFVDEVKAIVALRRSADQPEPVTGETFDPDPASWGEVGAADAEDAADVEGVPTPGQGVADYPQPKGARRRQAGPVMDKVKKVVDEYMDPPQGEGDELDLDAEIAGTNKKPLYSRRMAEWQGCPATDGHGHSCSLPVGHPRDHFTDEAGWTEYWTSSRHQAAYVDWACPACGFHTNGPDTRSTCSMCGATMTSSADDFATGRGEPGVAHGSRHVTAADLVGDIMAYEQGDLDEDATIALFQSLVDSGMAWKLQGSYGRTAMDLINAGLVTPPAGVEARRRTAADTCDECGDAITTTDGEVHHDNGEKHDHKAVSGGSDSKDARRRHAADGDKDDDDGYFKAPADWSAVDSVPMDEGEKKDARRRHAEGDFHTGEVRGASSLEQVKAYLPSNYTASQDATGAIWISGRDSAGWTWEDYVKPRLGSGLMAVVDASTEGQGVTWASRRTATYWEEPGDGRSLYVSPLRAENPGVAGRENGTGVVFMEDGRWRAMWEWYPDNDPIHGPTRDEGFFDSKDQAQAAVEAWAATAISAHGRRRQADGADVAPWGQEPPAPEHPQTTDPEGRQVGNPQSGDADSGLPEDRGVPAETLPTFFDENGDYTDPDVVEVATASFLGW